ncbi:MAG: hypothetical protein ACP5MB_11740, partial [bacterium]
SLSLPAIYGIYWASTGNFGSIVNYNYVFTSNNTSLTYGSSYIDIGTLNGGTAVYRWVRTRAYPPSGVMPTVFAQPFPLYLRNFAPKTSSIPYDSKIQTIFNFSSALSSALPWKILKGTSVLASGTTTLQNNLVNISSVLPAGLYNIELNINNGQFIRNTTLNITKATIPAITWTANTFVYNGT